MHRHRRNGRRWATTRLTRTRRTRTRLTRTRPLGELELRGLERDHLDDRAGIDQGTDPAYADGAGADDQDPPAGQVQVQWVDGQALATSSLPTQPRCFWKVPEPSATTARACVTLA